MYKANESEQEILKFWDQDKTFERSVGERPADKPYVFYDGPPFATGLPHYGHIVASTMKDTVPRYWTMKGHRVERRWGWDCHGLPIENIVEKELNLPGKKEIENFGVAQFNEACRSKVLMYADEWKKIIHRIGRWVDMENDYKTMDVDFMESVWWVFKQLWDKGYVYEGKKPMHVCPRCATPLSNFEVSQGYKDIKDMSVTAKFVIKDAEEQKKKWNIPEGAKVSLLAWTTTPWTLPGNILVAVGNEIDYVVVPDFVQNEQGVTSLEFVILAKDIYQQASLEKPESIFTPEQQKHFKNTDPLLTIKGSDLVGLTYEPLFPYFTQMEGAENGFRVLHADFVNTDEGTGLVHLAPAFGTDDYEVFRQENVPFIQHVTIDGRFIDEVTDFAGEEVKDRDDHMKADIEIVKYLVGKGTLFSKKKYEHSYPHCWRCDTPLLNYATSSWFVEVTKIKDQLLKNNQQINWIPEHIKDGRFGLWLEGARDWAVSRNRYWGTPLPVWKSEDGEVLCIGSVAELEQFSGKKVTDLHKHMIDDIVLEKDGKKYHKIPEVFDCWFESGSMPYAQFHYPFENKEKVEQGFPAQFIAEGQDQTRGWFYTLHVLATALTSGEDSAMPMQESSGAFANCIVNGMVLAEDGKKMSKRLQNYPDPMEVVGKYGADAMRFYLVSSPVMHSESLNFSEDGVREVFNKLCNTLWNVVEFYSTFQSGNVQDWKASESALDTWIVARLHQTMQEVTENMEVYRLAAASRPLVDFVLDLSQWYVRRSRDRFKLGDEGDKQAAISTLGYVLREFSKVLAPFAPFLAEKIWQQVMPGDSVHLQMWPEFEESKVDRQMLKEMGLARKVVEMGLSARKEAGIKVRQPLAYLRYQGDAFSQQLEQIIADELNVLEVKHTEQVREQDGRITRGDQGIKVGLSVELTEELEKAGFARELVRAINTMRKEKGYTLETMICVTWSSEDDFVQSVFEIHGEEVKRTTLTREFAHGAGESIEIDGRLLQLSVEKA
ncbi:isoleucine--tRNA ligase [Candidatus Nomurabacteria bacterium]|nr:isoleucine--tRNA ligase [Candidatus Nomurabacteria bacterium]